MSRPTFRDDDGNVADVNERTGEVRFRVRWDRIGQLFAAIALIVMGVSLVWSMLDLAAKPLPPCTAATIQHVCSGEPS